ncbi:hypothetical protein HDU89_007349 [Geranomyces variabilis]|nr:hypothetical protein HDU89_007349 [Geranomyces variabilis]
MPATPPSPTSAGAAAAVPTLPGLELFLDIDAQPGPAFASMWTRIFTGASLGAGICLIITIATALLLLSGHLAGAFSARRVTAIHRPAPNAANRRSRMAARASMYGGGRRASAYGGSQRNSAYTAGKRNSAQTGGRRTSQYSGNAKRQSVMFAFNDASGAGAAAGAAAAPPHQTVTKQRSDRHRMSIISVVTSPPELQPRGGRKRAPSSLAARRQSIFSFSGFGKAPHPQSTAARAHIRNSNHGGGAEQRTTQLLEFHPYQSPGTFVVATAEMYYAETASIVDDDWWDDGDVWDNVEILEEDYQSDDDDDALPPMPERIPLPPLPRVEKLPHMVLDVSSA